MSISISNHAVDRFCERIRPLNPDAARDEIRICMAAAKPKHWRKWSRQKRTCMLPTGCCVFVFEYGDLVTVLTKNQAGKRI